MLIQFLTLFPSMFDSPFAHSIIKRAQDNGLVKLETINFRAYAEDRHATVDDTPYGGGPGMILKPEPILKRWKRLKRKWPPNLYHSYLAARRDLHQGIAVELSAQPHWSLSVGTSEGYDERIRTLADRELSIGDYV